MAKKNLDEIAKKLEQGVAEVFESERYKAMLNVFSKFHRYSASNCLLIAMQMPTARAVAGYKAWQTKFGRQVKKGEKAITILAPCPHKKLVIDEETGEEKVIHWTTFKTTSVFDISQTEGEELPKLSIELRCAVNGYDELIEAIERLSPVPISIEDFDDSAYGYYSNAEKRIVVKSGLSEFQTVKTMLHEVAHAILHNTDDGLEKEADRMDKEVQAESVAYVVCQQLGLDTSEYSFGYVASWSKGKDSKVLCKNLDAIRKTASHIIDELKNDDKLSYVVTEEKKSA